MADKKPKITTALVRRAMLEDLAASGLTARHAARLGVRPLLPRDLASHAGFHVPGYALPYFDPDGGELPFFRIKLLAPAPDVPDMRYWQAEDTLPKAYFPPLLRASTWAEALADRSRVLYVTEGEKKAAAACAAGLTCLGLGGVWSFRSKKAGLSLLPELARAEWAGREVRVVFDSDVMYKPDVMRALSALTAELRRRGAASIRPVYLRAEDGAKVGLDDFLLARGVGGLEACVDDTEDALLAELNAVNAEYAVVRSSVQDKVFSVSRRQFVSVKAFTSVVEADRTVVVDGKQVDVTREWLRWPNRRTFRDIVFEPGRPATTEDGCFNRWRGAPFPPRKGSVRPFRDLLARVVPDAEAREWLLRWFAYPLQHPGTKLASAVVVWGDQGTGKTFLGRIVKDLYGEHGRYLDQVTMMSEFNDWLVDAQFAVADEVVFHGDRRESNLLKNIITRTSVDVNQKYQPRYTIRDCCNYYFTSNHSDAIYLERSDRRFFVVEAGERADLSFYQGVDRWLAGGGFSHVLHYLAYEVDCRGFAPLAPPPRNADKEDMIHESMSSLDQVLDEALRAPDAFFAVGGRPVPRDLWTAEEVLALLPPSLRNASHSAVGHALRRLGAPKFSINVPDEDGGPARFRRVYAVRNAERWRRARIEDRVRHYAAAPLSPGASGGKVVPIGRARRRKFDREG